MIAEVPTSEQLAEMRRTADDDEKRRGDLNGSPPGASALQDVVEGSHGKDEKTGLDTVTIAIKRDDGTSLPAITVFHPRHMRYGHSRSLSQYMTAMARVLTLSRLEPQQREIGHDLELEALADKLEDAEADARGFMGRYILDWGFVDPIDKTPIPAPKEDPDALLNITSEEFNAVLMSMRMASDVPFTSETS